MKTIQSILFALTLISSGYLFAAATSESSLEGASLEGLSYITKLTGAETSQAARYLVSFLETAGHTDKNSVSSRCFTKDRNTSQIDYMARLVGDYRSALGYSHYMEGVKEHYYQCTDVDTPFTYCSSLNDLERAVDTMKRSLANLVRFINVTAFNNVMSSSAMQSSDQSPEEEKEGVADSEDLSDEHCTNPCLRQQASIYRYLVSFASDYITTDVDGYLKHKK